MGAGYRKLKSLDPTMACFYLKRGLPFKHDMVENKVSEDAVLPVGTHITAAHFVAGQHWGFKDQPASHGVSLVHRAPGSIGNWKDLAVCGRARSCRGTWAMSGARCSTA